MQQTSPCSSLKNLCTRFSERKVSAGAGPYLTGSSSLPGIKAAPLQFRKVTSPLGPLRSPIQERGGFKTTFIHTDCSCDKLGVLVNPNPGPARFMSIKPNSDQASPQLNNLQWLPTACMIKSQKPPFPCLSSACSPLSRGTFSNRSSRDSSQ